MENFDLPNVDSSLLCLLWSIVFGDRTAHRLTGGVPAGGLGSIWNYFKSLQIACLTSIVQIVAVSQSVSWSIAQFESDLVLGPFCLERRTEGRSGKLRYHFATDIIGAFCGDNSAEWNKRRAKFDKCLKH